MLNKLASIDIECRKVRLESIISDICSSVIFDNASALANDVAQLLIDTSKQVRNKFSKLVSCGDDEFIDDCIRKSQTDILNPDGNCLRSLLSSDKDQLITLKFMLSLLKSIDVTVIQNQISLIVEDVIWQQSEFIIEPLRNMFASRLLLDFDVLNASQFAMSFSSKVNELTRKLHFLGNSGNNDRLTQKSQWSLLNDILRHALLSVIQIIRCNVLSPSNLHQLQVDIGYIKQLLNQFPIEATVNGLLSDEIIECAMVRCIKPMPKTNQEIQSLLHSDR
ncbi:hypothetical protein GJ496_005141 [Pomphorhynchus laevis]|nr:hypothetical protein GJ496_005141 [Pomphorhynchus laevis]